MRRPAGVRRVDGGGRDRAGEYLYRADGGQIAWRSAPARASHARPPPTACRRDAPRGKQLELGATRGLTGLLILLQLAANDLDREARIRRGHPPAAASPSRADIHGRAVPSDPRRNQISTWAAVATVRERRSRPPAVTREPASRAACRRAQADPQRGGAGRPDRRGGRARTSSPR